MVSVALVPGATDSEAADDLSVKLPPAVMTIMMLVVAFKVPEVPVRVTLDVPTVAVVLAANVSTSVVAVGLVTPARVTPLGRPLALIVTVPVNPLRSVTVMVTVQLPPWGIVHVVGEAAIVKLPVDETTVPEMLMVAVVVPEVPFIVAVNGPTAAVALAVHVNTLVVVTGLVPNVQVTPEGRPEIVSVTLPVNPPTSVIVTVSVVVFP
jgi:hypothetical protein